MIGRPDDAVLPEPPAPDGERRRSSRPAAAAVLALLLLAVLGVVLLVLLRLARPEGMRIPSGEATATVTYTKSFANKDGSPLRNPLGLAVVGDRVYVSEADAGVVRVFSADGVPLASLPLPKRSDGATAYPSALADLGGERLGVVDLAGQRVLVLSLERADFGKVTGELGSSYRKTKPLQPTAIVAKDDHVIVADAADHVLKEYDIDGSLEAVLGKDLQPPLTFVGGLALDGERVLASDSNAGRIVRLPTTEGTPTLFPARFTLPRGLAVTTRGVVVADAFAKRAVLYEPSGAEIQELSVPGAGGWTPHGVGWMESVRRYYVTDPSSGKVMIFRARTE